MTWWHEHTGNLLESLEVLSIRHMRESSQEANQIPDIKVTDDVCINQLALGISALYSDYLFYT